MAKLASETNLETRRRGDQVYLDRPGKIAERVFISISSRNLGTSRVDLYPADTVAQAHRFFDKVKEEAFLSLEESGHWKVKPNLHFSFISKHLIWAETDLPTRDYLEFFSGSSSYGQKQKDDLLCLCDQWERMRLIRLEARTRSKTSFPRRIGRASMSSQDFPSLGMGA